MWCRRCSQDVPAVATADGASELACGRCGTVLKGNGDVAASVHATSVDTRFSPQESAAVPQQPETTSSSSQPVTVASSISLLGLDDWGLTSDLERAEVLLRQHSEISETGRATGGALRRVDPRHGHKRGVVSTNDGQSPIDRAEREPEGRSLAVSHLSWYVWLLICGGMMSLVFGMVLCGWSLGTARDDLWRVGLPALLLGQAMLLLGFVFQLDSLWRNHRQSHVTIERLERSLDELQGDGMRLPVEESSVTAFRIPTHEHSK